MKFIDTEGLSKDDNKLLQGMLKYDLNLSKDNIGKAVNIISHFKKLTVNKHSNARTSLFLPSVSFLPSWY